MARGGGARPRGVRGAPPPRVPRGTAAVAVRPVRIGHGMVARRGFAPGALIVRIRGTLLTSAAVWRVWTRDPRRAANCYRYDADRYLSPAGHVADFSNHSCRPNAIVRREGRALVLRALRPIARGEEITHDYATLLGADDVWTMRCRCGERTCRGVVRRFDRLPPRLLARYLRAGAIPAHILATAAARRVR